MPERPVNLRVSTELLNAIGTERFEQYLTMLNPTSMRRLEPHEYPWPEPYNGAQVFTVIYRIVMPNAPDNATEIVPIYQNRGENGNVSVDLIDIDWYDADGHRIPAAPV